MLPVMLRSSDGPAMIDSSSIAANRSFCILQTSETSDYEATGFTAREDIPVKELS
jgi:hypothetical protein